MLKGKTLLITGASRGIGLAIALRAARDGANISILAKTTVENPKLPGTIYSAAKEIEAAGGKALPIVCDIRDESQIEAAVKETVEKFGGIDICINNASAIWLKGTLDTPVKRYDLMHQVNTRGTYATTRACLPHLIESAKKNRNPHVLNISPPLNMKPVWFKDHLPYTMAKYGMSLCVLGHAAEFAEHKVAVNALWPRKGIATAAIYNVVGKEIYNNCRKPEIMADAAYHIFKRPHSCTGNFFIDDEVLISEGETDLEKYTLVPGSVLFDDFFLDPVEPISKL
jgi:citronellol/citronellal dehydrogenase